MIDPSICNESLGIHRVNNLAKTASLAMDKLLVVLKEECTTIPSVDDIFCIKPDLLIRENSPW